MRLRYEVLSADHAQALFAALADPAVYQFIDDRPPASVGELAGRFERMTGGPPAHRTHESWWNYALLHVESGRAIGRIQATIVRDRAEIAYLVGSDYWGYGYAREAVTWLHRQLRERTAVSTFWATARPENVRSIGLLCRLGYTRVNQWPDLASYDPGDVVYCRSATAASRAST
jgi:[ribosomal protein S5]-alanine N-acetyltransferase